MYFSYSWSAWLTCSDVVTIQTVGGNSPCSEVVLESEADGSLSGSTESSEPDTAATETAPLTNHLPSLVSSHMTSFECDIGCLYYVLKIKEYMYVHN